VLIFLAYFPGMAGSTGGAFIKEMLSPYLVATDVPALTSAARLALPGSGVGSFLADPVAARRACSS